MITGLLILLAGAAYFFWRCPNLRKTWYWPPRKGLAVLMYHHIGVLDDPNDEQFPFTVTPEMFEAQLAFLKANGYTPLSPADLQQPDARIKKPVMLTFDDGYADNFTALFPLLQKHRVPALIFLVTDRIGTDGYLTWEQVQLMQKSGLVHFGSHTCSHRRLRSLPDEEIWQEITQSKKILEEKLGAPVLSFCYPYGAGGFDKRVRPKVLQAGYRFDFSTKKGINPWPWKGKGTLLRAFPRGGETLFDYRLQLTRGRSKL